MGQYVQEIYEKNALKFSIIVPVYNVEGYIVECLESIINQTYSNFEVICINDGSTDNSLNILNEYAQKDKRFVIIDQENCGQGVARNKAIDITNGDYIVFVDPDDYIDTNMLEVLSTKLRETHATVIHFDYISFSEKRQRLHSFQKNALKSLKFKLANNSFYNIKDFKTDSHLTNYALAVWDKAYSREFIQSNNIKFAPNKHGEDHIFSLGVLLLAGKIYYTNEITYHYRQRIGSAVNKASNDNFCIFDNIQYLKEFLHKHNLFDDYKNDFNKYAILVLGWHLTCIPEDGITKYLKLSSELLSPKDYKLFIKNFERKDNSFLEWIFSIKNQKRYGKKVKLITILGLQFRITKPQNKEAN